MRYLFVILFLCSLTYGAAGQSEAFREAEDALREHDLTEAKGRLSPWLEKTATLSSQEKQTFRDLLLRYVIEKQEPLQRKTFRQKSAQEEAYLDILPYVRTASALDPSDSEAAQRAAEIALRSGELQEAESFAERALTAVETRPDLEPEHADLFLTAVRIRLARKQQGSETNFGEEILLLEKAARRLEAARKEQSEKAAFLAATEKLERMRFDLMLKTPAYREEARNLLESRLEAQPDNVALRLIYADFLRKQDPIAAISAYKSLVESPNAPYVAYLRLAEVYLKQERYQNARTVLEEGLEKTERPNLILPLLIRVCNQSGQADAARRYEQQLRALRGKE